MSFSRRLRRWIAGGLMMVVLFTQLAIAAYACPAPVSGVQQTPAAVTAAMPDCQGMDMQSDFENPQLCKAHCSHEAQSTARAVVPDLQPNPASLALLVRLIEPLPPLAAFTPYWRERPDEPAAPSLPLYLALQVLRN